MKIKRVTVTPIAFNDPPLLNASGIHEPFALRSIIEVETDNGLVGLGESYGDAPVLSTLQLVGGELVGLDPFDLNGLRARIKAAAGACSAPRSAARSSRQDRIRRSRWRMRTRRSRSRCSTCRRDTSMHRWSICWAGRCAGEVPFSAYLFFKYAQHIDTPYPPDPWGEGISEAQIVAQAKRMIDLYGFGSIKLKAGRASTGTRGVDACRRSKPRFPSIRCASIRTATGRSRPAMRMAKQLGDALEYYEDPTPGLDGMAELHRRTGLPLATNMVVTDFDELRRSIALNSVQIVLSDHHYWGGLRDTQVLARMCDVFGLGLSMHSNSHLGISLMAMSHVAASVTNLTYACDTHYPWQDDDDEVLRGGKLAIRNGTVTLRDAPGLGIELDHERLRARHEAFLSCGIRQRDDVKQMQRYRPDWSQIKPRF